MDDLTFESARSMRTVTTQETYSTDTTELLLTDIFDHHYNSVTAYFIKAFSDWTTTLYLNCELT